MIKATVTKTKATVTKKKTKLKYKIGTRVWALYISSKNKKNCLEAVIAYGYFKTKNQYKIIFSDNDPQELSPEDFQLDKPKKGSFEALVTA